MCYSAYIYFVVWDVELHSGVSDWLSDLPEKEMRDNC